MDNTKPDYSNQPTITKKNKLPIVIIFVILIIALTGGIFLFNRNKSSKPSVQVARVVTEAPTPSPTPTPTIDKKSVKIQVLNGTGTPGQAGKVATALKNAGYNPDNIKTGNSSDNLTASLITSKARFESITADMKTVLSPDFPDIAIASSQLGTDNEFDVVITTGGKKYEAPKLTPTPTDSTTPTSTPINTTGTLTPTPTTITTPTPTSTPTLTPTPTI